MTLERKAVAAQQLLDNEMLKETLASMELDIINSLKRTMVDGSPEGEDTAIELVRKLQAGEMFAKKLKERIANHKISEANNVARMASK